MAMRYAHVPHRLVVVVDGAPCPNIGSRTLVFHCFHFQQQYIAQDYTRIVVGINSTSRTSASAIQVLV